MPSSFVFRVEKGSHYGPTPDGNSVVSFKQGEMVTTQEDLRKRFPNKFSLVSETPIFQKPAPPPSPPVEEEDSEEETTPSNRGEEVTDQFEGALDKDCTVYKNNELYDLYVNGIAKNLQISEKKVRSVISKL